MHSRMSSTSPRSIFLGRNGSAMEGRAAPIMSSTPRRICDTMVSGDVNLPTPTTGLVVTVLTNRTNPSWYPSAANREVLESLGQSLTLTSHRSGNSASIATTSRPSDCALMPSAPRNSPTGTRPARPHPKHPAALAALRLGPDALGPPQRVAREPHGHGAIQPNGLLGILDQFAQQPC